MTSSSQNCEIVPKKVTFNIRNQVDEQRKKFADSLVNFSGWVKQKIDLEMYGHAVPMYFAQPVIETVDVQPISEEEQLEQFL